MMRVFSSDPIFCDVLCWQTQWPVIICDSCLMPIIYKHSWLILKLDLNWMMNENNVVIEQNFKTFKLEITECTAVHRCTGARSRCMEYLQQLKSQIKNVFSSAFQFFFSFHVQRCRSKCRTAVESIRINRFIPLHSINECLIVVSKSFLSSWSNRISFNLCTYLASSIGGAFICHYVKRLIILPRCKNKNRNSAMKCMLRILISH